MKAEKKVLPLAIKEFAEKVAGKTNKKLLSETARENSNDRKGNNRTLKVVF